MRTLLRVVVLVLVSPFVVCGFVFALIIGGFVAGVGGAGNFLEVL